MYIALSMKHKMSFSTAEMREPTERNIDFKLKTK